MRIAPLVLALVLTPALARAQYRKAPEGRYAAPLAIGVRLGAVAALSSVAPGTPSGIGGGLYGLFDLQSLLADVSIDYFGGSDVSLLAGGLGVYWAVLPESFTPYLGGGTKLAWTRFGGAGAAGLQLFGAAGLLGDRRWSPQVRIELAWFVDTFGERPRGGGPAHFSHGPMATIGLGF